MTTRPLVDVAPQPCRICGHDTFLPEEICAICGDPPKFPNGRYECCGGYGEHFIPCAVGDVIAAARHSLAARQVRRLAHYERIPGTELFDGPVCRRCGGRTWAIGSPGSDDPDLVCVTCNPTVPPCTGEPFEVTA